MMMMKTMITMTAMIRIKNDKVMTAVNTAHAALQQHNIRQQHSTTAHTSIAAAQHAAATQQTNSVDIKLSLTCNEVMHDGARYESKKQRTRSSLVKPPSH